MLSDYVVKTEVHLIKCKCFLDVACVDGTETLLNVTIVDFKACKLRIFNSNIDTDHCKSKHVGFVSFEGTGNSELILTVSI